MLCAEIVVSHCYFSASAEVVEQKVRYARERCDETSLVGPSLKCGVLTPAGLGFRGVKRASHRWMARWIPPITGGILRML